MPKLRWEDYETDDGKKGLYVTDDAVINHTVAEGLIGEIINEAFGALEGIQGAVEEKKSEKAIRDQVEASYHVIRYEVESRLENLETFKRKDLRPKHRDCRVILARASRVMAQNSPLLEDHKFDHDRFVSDAVNMVKALHMCLDESTTKKHRESVRRGYINVATHL